MAKTNYLFILRDAADIKPIEQYFGETFIDISDQLKVEQKDVDDLRDTMKRSGIPVRGDENALVGNVVRRNAFRTAEKAMKEQRFAFKVEPRSETHSDRDYTLRALCHGLGAHFIERAYENVVVISEGVYFTYRRSGARGFPVDTTVENLSAYVDTVGAITKRGYDDRYYKGDGVLPPDLKEEAREEA